MARLRPPTHDSSAPSALPHLSRGEANATAPKVPASPPFWLVFYPDRWCVMEDRVVPQLQNFHLRHTINGVVQLLDGTYQVADAEQLIRQKGGTVLPWDIDDEPYLVEAAPGHWTTRWTGLIPGSGHTRVDAAGYVEWLVSLQARGLIPKPEPRHLAALVERLRFDLETTESATGSTHRTRQLAQQVQLVEAEIKAAAKPPPKRRRAAKKKTTLPLVTSDE